MTIATDRNNGIAMTLVTGTMGMPQYIMLLVTGTMGMPWHWLTDKNNGIDIS